MALYGISDLHLPLGVDKPMDVFGKSWENYVYRLEENWRNKVQETDCVVLPGDFCWAINLEEAEKDFAFLNKLPGIKVLLKGNHDYWWDTLTKVEKFMAEHQFSNIKFIQNNYIDYNGTALCGTRFWMSPEFEHQSAQDMKIYQRELGRVEFSLASAQRAGMDDIVFFVHYPPVVAGKVDKTFLNLMKKYGINDVYYGHLHSISSGFELEQCFEDVHFHLISCNCINFDPVLIR